MSIEDTVLPRPYGSGGKPSLSAVEEGVGKRKAALSARQDKNLVIARRTSCPDDRQLRRGAEARKGL
jgi:carboxyvinyl-carboxyphosphonate phosphorylmutase